MIEIGMLSCGHVHTRGYCEAIAKREDCRLGVIWDDMEERGRKFAATYGAEYSGDLAGTTARRDVQAWIICAENAGHLRLLEAAAPTGKAVFCEKPLTTNVREAREAMALIRKYRTPVVLGYFQLFTAGMQGVARLLAEGTLGKVTHARYRNAHNAAYGRWFDSPEVAWFTDPAAAGGGAFLDMGTHAVHALRRLLGPVERVWATIRNVSGIYPRVDDAGTAVLEFASGAVGTVEASWVQTGGFGGIEITGSKATLYNHPERGLVYGAPREEFKAVAPGEAKPDRLERLLAAVKGTLGEEEMREDLAAAAETVAIIEAAYESSRSGKWVRVNTVTSDKL